MHGGFSQTEISFRCTVRKLIAQVMLAQEIFVNPDVRKEIPKYREKFLSAQPFKHVVIDNFLSAQMSEKVLEEFPSFNTKKAMNELGYVAGKAVNENLGSISSTYNKLASYLESFDFLRNVKIQQSESVLANPMHLVIRLRIF